RRGESESSFQQSFGSVCFGSMSLPVEEMASIGATTAGCDLTPRRDALTHIPASQAMARLQRLHAAAGHLAENAPEIIADPNAARGLEQTLIEAMVACLDNGEAREDSVAQRRHELIMRRFRRVVEENPEESLYVPEICKAIGVAGRTLRLCCEEQLGMGPKHYLLLRRLHLVRRALRRASPAATTATQVGAPNGMCALVGFAAEHHSF